LHFQTVASSTSTDFKNPFSFYICDVFEFFDDICYGWVDGIGMLTGPESIPDLSFAATVDYA